MARSIAIDHIGFANMKRGTDSIIVKDDESKSNKAGEKCTNKNVLMPIPQILLFAFLLH